MKPELRRRGLLRGMVKMHSQVRDSDLVARTRIVLNLTGTILDSCMPVKCTRSKAKTRPNSPSLLSVQRIGTVHNSVDPLECGGERLCYSVPTVALKDPPTTSCIQGTPHGRVSEGRLYRDQHHGHLPFKSFSVISSSRGFSRPIFRYTAARNNV